MGQIFLAILAGVCSKYLFKVCIVSLSVCYATILSLQGLHCFIICLLRHHTISSRFPLFHYPFVTSLLCSMLRLCLPLFLTSLFYSRFRPSLPLHILFRRQTISSRLPFCIICLLRQCSSLRLFFPLFLTRHYLFRLFLRHYPIFSRFLLFYYLLITSLICSRLRFSLLLFVTSVYY